jgi:transcriptional regulator with XRE-family HTH domain
MTPEQCRMARAALNMSAADLASVAGVGYATVARFETGAIVKPESVAAMRSALEKAGIHFWDKGPFAGAVQRRLRPVGTR